MQKAEPIVRKIARAKRRNSSFAYFTPDDIEQEVWALALEALPRYRSSMGELEHFLSNHITNRLKNLKRDKYYRPEQDASAHSASRARMNLINALPLGGGDVAESGRVLCSPRMSADPAEELICEETKDYIAERLPIHLQNAFYSVVNGHKLRKPLREELQQAVQEILDERPTNE